MQIFGSPEDFDRDDGRDGGSKYAMKKKRVREDADDGAEKTRCKVSVLPKTLTGTSQYAMKERSRDGCKIRSWEDEMQSFGSPEDFDRDDGDKENNEGLCNIMEGRMSDVSDLLLIRGKHFAQFASAL